MSFSQLKLTLPRQNLQSSKDTVYKYKNIFLNQLANAEAFLAQSDSLVTNLHNLNRTSLSGDERYHLTIPVIQKYLVLLSSIRQTVPGQVATDLNKEMGYACKLLLRDCPPHSADEKSQFVHWALVALSEQLRDHYEKYMSEPQGLWGEVHRVYEFGQSHRLNSFTNAPLNRTIEETYKQILLLATAEPYRLTVKESRLLFTWLGNWAEKATLNFQESPELNHHFFYVDLSRNAGVLNHSQVCNIGNDESIMAFNPLPVIDRAKQHMVMIRKGNHPSKLGFGKQSDPIDGFVVLRKTIQAWTKTTSRRHERKGCNVHVELAFGLHQIHNYLRQSRKTETPVVEGTALNASESGSCIEIPANGEFQPRVGDVIAQRQDGENDRKIAVVRWLKRSFNTVLFGLEYIAGQAQPVAVRIRDQLAEALLVSSAQNDMLITRQGFYHNGEDIRVKLPHHDSLLKAVSGPLVGRMGGTDQFKIKRS